MDDTVNNAREEAIKFLNLEQDDIIIITGGIHHNKYRSLGASFVMSRSTEICLKSDSFAGALLGADSEVFSMDSMHEVRIAVSDHKKVRMLKSRDISYFDRLQSLF